MEIRLQRRRDWDERVSERNSTREMCTGVISDTPLRDVPEQGCGIKLISNNSGTNV